MAQAFGDGEARHWYHLNCGAERRPEPFLEALAACTETITDRPELEQRAQLGLEHPRWTRIVRVERAPSGRARCRHCKELIEKDALRLGLEVIEDAMANPAGFLHPACCAEYAGTLEGLVERVKRAGAEEADLSELSRQLTPS